MGKSIMIQGTMSGVGKSLITAGLCRILKQDGFHVAPFKSQNMALNSFITEEGLEMGRAQVVQAEAAGVIPTVRMNPVLLKPTCDTGSQVIVMGEVLGNMSAREYFKFKRTLIPQIKQAYEDLKQEYDYVVIEGAGSPAEINLKSEDIVNMGMAKIASAPVLLAGDIDRGGVFAQLAGTMMLLEPDEKSMVKGLLVNKFRGDVSILQPGISMLEDICSVPVAGVIPYMRVDIEEEDSLSERLCMHRDIGSIDIAVIRLPRLSNYTDFHSLESTSGVSLRYVGRPQDMKDPDMIIVPGTKNTMEDLLWLRQSGLEAEILKQEAKGKVIFGICGGYQMLGETVSDPTGAERKGMIAGLSLLPVKTVIQKDKTRTRVEGIIQNIEGTLKGLNGLTYEGYEIHMGATNYLDEMKPMAYLHSQTAGENSSETPDGASKNHVYGTYVHGIFDREDIRKEILRSLSVKKGLNPDAIVSFNFKEYKEKQYDELAGTLRKSLNMSEIYKIIERGI